MRFIFSLLAGVVGAAISILLHPSFPPFGVLAALTVSYCSIWVVGHIYGSRKFKFVALIGWFALIFKAGSFGVGQELLIQGDGVGSALLLLGSLAVFAAVVARI